jgi:hypothetical protein
MSQTNHYGRREFLKSSAASVSKRIHGAEPVTGQITGTGGTLPKTVQLQPGIEFYVEEDELAS